MLRRGLLWSLAALAAAGCSDANLAEPQGLSPEAGQYLDYALDVMEFNSIRRYEIDWPSFRDQTWDEAGNARTPADTHDAIRSALDRIGDNHSFFQAPGGGPQGTPALAAAPAALADPITQLVTPDIGYLEVPAFSGGGADATQLAELYHSIIEDVDATDVCRWVVDLRGNTGGNMWPMLAGVGPILGADTVGFFVDPDSVVSTWWYAEGEAILDSIVIVGVDPYYDVQQASPAVAVLTDGHTASSGEAIAVAFRGRPETRSFGEPTFGVSTANAPFGLPDGAVIFLTVATMADRTGEIYGQSLDPDSVVVGTKTGDRATDAALDAALDWLETLACS